MLLKWLWIYVINNLPPAKIAAISEINHSGELNPSIPTAPNRSNPNYFLKKINSSINMKLEKIFKEETIHESSPLQQFGTDDNIPGTNKMTTLLLSYTPKHAPNKHSYYWESWKTAGEQSKPLGSKGIHLLLSRHIPPLHCQRIEPFRFCLLRVKYPQKFHNTTGAILVFHFLNLIFYYIWIQNFSKSKFLNIDFFE